MSSEETSVAPSYPGISARIRKVLPSVPFVASETKTHVDISVEPEHLVELVIGLRDKREFGFDFLSNMAGVDLEAEGMALKYHLYSFANNHTIQVTVPTSAGHPHVPSLTGIFPAADWHEREAAEMFGFVFDGHPNLKNLLLEEDLRIHPLLKAHPLQPMELKQGIESGPPGYSF